MVKNLESASLMNKETAPIDALADRAAGAILDALCRFQAGFSEITRRARRRFENRDWNGLQADSTERLELYPRSLQEIVATVRNLLGNEAENRDLWRVMKESYAARVENDRNLELAETFYNSITRRIFYTVGVSRDIEFVPTESSLTRRPETLAPFDRHEPSGDTRALVEAVLENYRFGVDYEDMERDARLVADRIDTYISTILGTTRIDAIETLVPVFFRNKGAYIIGRIRSGNQIVPMVLPLLHEDRGVFVDTVLLTESEVSILFSFTRSYFLATTDCPRELIVFLKSIMPLKPVAEIYISLGFNRHGKTELYRSLRRHIEPSSDRFQIAEGDTGMVMLVFTLPFYDVVFKVIRDRFAYPKTTTRQDVMDRYRLVFKRDRVGRLVDAQEFEHLRFRKDRFTDELLEELAAEAADSVKIGETHLSIRHLYTERKVTPLNLYLRISGPRAARDAVIDYGHAIKDLAAANIFPGDFLLKNFGVTRHGRVVFYDYDELCLLTDCNFRRIPPPRNLDDELSAEPWFSVAENDIFPEEFVKFLGLGRELKEVFLRYHSDLFTAEFWKELQNRHFAGEVIDVFPYTRTKRLRVR
jgi:isocitrate dehydrogenase kinase/phosphatase